MDIICQEKTEPTTPRDLYARGIETGVPVLELLDALEQTTIKGPGAFLLKAAVKQLRYLVGYLCTKKIINLHEYEVSLSVMIHRNGTSYGANQVEKPHAEPSA